MASNVVIDGWAELDTKLLGLSDKIAKQALKQSVSAGAKFMQKAVKDKAPELNGFTWGEHQPPGTLKRSIITVFCPELSNDYEATYKVAVKMGKKYRNKGKKGNLSQDAFYAEWVERGHYYVPPNPNFTISDRGIRHGSNWEAHRTSERSLSNARFVPAHPFMRPAWDVEKDQALEVIRQQLETKIEELAAT